MRPAWPAPPAAITVGVALAGSAAAHESKAGNPTIEHLSPRPTPPGAEAGAGRFDVHAIAVGEGAARMRRVMRLDLAEPTAKGRSPERAGTVPVRFAVEGFGAAAEPSHAERTP